MAIKLNGDWWIETVTDSAINRDALDTVAISSGDLVSPKETVSPSFSLECHGFLSRLDILARFDSRPAAAWTPVERLRVANEMGEAYRQHLQGKGQG